ncbi:MAG: M14 family metallopeptidase [Alphaproteobacteria bacterium]|nr:M14 family metallopeptidase [Alphaproteobacteria bacterium]
MPTEIETIHLQPIAPGRTLSLVARRYGDRGARPKAYLQASLHADEIPAMMAAHHLARLLDAAEADGRIRGEVVLVPAANPIGLGQYVNGQHLGRNELGGEGNFNRGWPHLSPALSERLSGKLGADGTANVALIRATMLEILDELEPRTSFGGLRVELLKRAVDADFVLDLHCDSEALVHLYIGTPLWPDAEDLSRYIGSEATLLAEVSGGNPFDEACSAPFWELKADFPEAAIPAACLACTVEYRGRADVHDSLGEIDAQGLLNFLIARGVVDGTPDPLPPALCDATPLDATDVVKAPAAGILAYHVTPGDYVMAGTPIAELIDPMAEQPGAGRRPITTQTDGRVLSIRAHKLVRKGDSVAKVVGRTPLESRQGVLVEP